MKAHPSGQAVLETLLTAPLLGLVAIVFVFLVWTGFGKIWADFVCYEAAMCLAERQSVQDCTQQARGRLRWLPRTVGPRLSQPYIQLQSQTGEHSAVVKVRFGRSLYVTRVFLNDENLVRALRSWR